MSYDKELLENGTDVLVFTYIQSLGINQDMEHFIRGKIIKSEMSDDLSLHGSPWYVINYTVLGEDGKEYFGNYGHPTLGNSFFMTIKDYTEYLRHIISEKEKKLSELSKTISDYKNLLKSLQRIDTMGNKEDDDKVAYEVCVIFKSEEEEKKFSKIAHYINFAKNDNTKEKQNILSKKK